MNRTVPHQITLTILLSLSVLAHTAKTEATSPAPHANGGRADRGGAEALSQRAECAHQTAKQSRDREIRTLGGSPLVSLAGEPVHLFLLSGQSNMANLKPEQVFSPEIQKHFGAENVVIVKVAQKGEPIRRWYKNWKVAGDQNPAEIGDIYKQLIEVAKKSLNGRTVKSVTLVWMQGERDAKERLSAQYEEAFLGMLKQIKMDFDVPEINYIIGRLSDSGLGKKDWDDIREVQQKLGEAGPHSAWINTDDLNDDNASKPNDLHFSEKGYRLLAERFASKAIELLRNAEPGAKQP